VGLRARAGASAVFRGCALVVGLQALSCASAPDPNVGEQRSRVVYGNDDRLEFYQVADEQLRRFARTQVAAILPNDAVLEVADAVEIKSEPLGAVQNLCPSEPFISEPAGAYCTGVALGQDILLTAAHCVRDLPCDRMSIVFGYRYDSEGVLATLSKNDVYTCARVLAMSAGSDSLDYAWVLLDRPIRGQSIGTVRSRTDALEPGELVTELGFSEGLPVKVGAGRVADPHAAALDIFTAALDAFGGNSGSPVVDENLRIVGIQRRGAPDYQPTPAGCTARVRLDDGTASGREEITYAFRALEGLCRTNSDEVLCGSDAACSIASTGLSSGSMPERRAPFIWWVVGFAALGRRHRRANARPRSRTA
jgi:hypothetical protein